MSKVIVDEYQSLDQALIAFNRQVYKDKASRWYKRRYGYYEKPSVLKRKKNKMKRVLSHRGTMFQDQARFQYQANPDNHTLWLKIDLTQQFARDGVNAVGR